MIPVASLKLTMERNCLHSVALRGTSGNDDVVMTYSLVLPMAGVFAAAVLRGFTGFGFGLAAVPLLSLTLSPTTVVPLVETFGPSLKSLMHRSPSQGPSRGGLEVGTF